MDKKDKVKVLALLEAYRLHVDDKKEQNADHAIRVCQAIIANVFGYSNRANWSDDIQSAGLIDYGHEADKYEQYKTLTSIVTGIRI